MKALRPNASRSQLRLRSPALMALSAVGLITGCGPGMLEVGSRYVHAEMIIAAEGGGFVVTATESPELAGLGITVEPGALAEDTLVTVEPFADLQTSSGVLRVGPAVRFGPSDAGFTRGVSIHLRINESLEGFAPVVRFETDNDAQDVRTGISTGARRITFTTTRFGQFQPGRGEALMTGCRSDTDCAPGQFCDVPNQQCLPAPPCRGDGDCGATEICRASDSVCIEGCRTHAQCTAGNACDIPTSTCRPGCRADTECSTGQICEETRAQCQTGCRLDVDCAQGQQFCDLQTNLCESLPPPPPNGCQTDADCVRGQQVCNLQTNMCEAIPPPPGCRTDVDCPRGQTCNLQTFMCE